jgi:hypothetical protein
MRTKNGSASTTRPSPAVSTYTYQQSTEDGATVPLYYENRIPELEFVNENFSDEFNALIEDADLDEDQERELEKRYGRQYHLITREDRLDRIADDLVHHFVGRGYRGKAMFVAIDKASALCMLNKVPRNTRPGASCRPMTSCSAGWPPSASSRMRWRRTSRCRRAGSIPAWWRPPETARHRGAARGTLLARPGRADALRGFGDPDS